MVRYKVLISIILLVLPIYSQNMFLYNVNGWSYAGAWGITDMENTGMRIEEGLNPSDSVQRFNSYGWTTLNASNEWRQTNSFGKWPIIEKPWPTNVLIDTKLDSCEGTIFLIGITTSLFDTVTITDSNSTGKGMIGSGSAPIPVLYEWQTINVPILDNRGTLVSALGIDFPIFTTDSCYTGIQILLNNMRFVLSNGDTILVDPFQAVWPTAVELIPNLVPNGFVLSQNYPNPFNPNTKIRYEIPELSSVKLTVYNLLGEEVAELVNSEQQMGVYEVDFNASSLASGTYIYILQTGTFRLERKMIVLK